MYHAYAWPTSSTKAPSATRAKREPSPTEYATGVAILLIRQVRIVPKDKTYNKCNKISRGYFEAACKTKSGATDPVMRKAKRSRTGTSE